MRSITSLLLTVGLVFLLSTDRVRAAAVALQNATATFSQTAFSAGQTIDTNYSDYHIQGNGWAILDGNGVSSAQTIVWETTTDLGTGAPQSLTFTLSQVFGHATFLENIGRFRLSATTASRTDFADGLDNGGDVSTSWTVLVPTSATSTNGNSLTLQGDNSLLAGGAASPSTTYTVKANTSLVGITGFRLEVLEDPSLPTNGPGLASDGNFVLTEFTVDAVAVPEPSSIVMLSMAGIGVWQLCRKRL